KSPPDRPPLPGVAWHRAAPVIWLIQYYACLDSFPIGGVCDVDAAAGDRCTRAGDGDPVGTDSAGPHPPTSDPTGAPYLGRPIAPRLSGSLAQRVHWRTRQAVARGCLFRGGRTGSRSDP